MSNGSRIVILCLIVLGAAVVAGRLRRRPAATDEDLVLDDDPVDAASVAGDYPHDRSDPSTHQEVTDGTATIVER